MRHLEEKLIVHTDGKKLFAVLNDLPSYPTFIRGIKAVNVESSSDSNLDYDTVRVDISIRYFTGSVTANVWSDYQKKELRVDLIKGPFQIAKAVLKIEGVDGKDLSEVTVKVQYATPIAVYVSLIESKKVEFLKRFFNLMSHRVGFAT